MGIRKRGEREVSEPCDICGLDISYGEYVLMKWIETDMTSTRRKVYCEDYHTVLINLKKQGKYDYDRCFITK